MSFEATFSYDGSWRRKRAGKKGSTVIYRVPTFHLRRVPIEVRVAGSLDATVSAQSGFLLGPDLTLDFARIVSPSPLVPYQKIQLTIRDEAPFHLVGWVRWCRPVALNSRVIGPHSNPYRIEIKFEAQSRVEQHRLQRYLQSFRERYLFSERF